MIRDLAAFLTQYLLWVIAILALIAYTICAAITLLALIFTKGPLT